MQEDRFLFLCKYNNKTYYLDFIGPRGQCRYNAYLFDTSTGEIGEEIQNAEVGRLAEKMVWQYS